jgi:hypothetical protein
MHTRCTRTLGTGNCVKVVTGTLWIVFLVHLASLAADFGPELMRTAIILKICLGLVLIKVALNIT